MAADWTPSTAAVGRFAWRSGGGNIRRFAGTIEEARFRFIYLSHAGSTCVEFLRWINRAQDLPMRQHSSDLFYTPRCINQLALHFLIQGAVLGMTAITTKFVAQQLNNHPLYDPAGGP